MNQPKHTPQGQAPQTHPKKQSVTQRARDISMIAGRGRKHPTDLDVDQAKKELSGDDARNDAADEPGIMAQRLDKRPFSTGNKIESQLPDDDQTVERIVQEGVDEAGHDEMVAASKTRTKSEG